MMSERVGEERVGAEEAPRVRRLATELATAITAARRGATAILEVVDAARYTKGDGSPVTDADLVSDRAIRETIGAAFPTDAILTEEGADDPARLSARRCWVVDPLDGTKQFIAGTGNYDVLVALVEDGRPVVAVSCHPPTGLVTCAVEGEGAWLGGEDGGGYWRLLRFDSAVPRPARVVASIWYGAPDVLPVLGDRLAWLAAMPIPTLPTGLNPRYWAGPVRDHDAFVGWEPASWGPDGGRPNVWMAGGEWDLVVSDLIVREAGGGFSTLDGSPHRYNKPVARNEGGLVIAATAALHLDVVAALDAPAGMRSGAADTSGRVQ